jgi:hypothetical protein
MDLPPTRPRRFRSDLPPIPTDPPPPARFRLFKSDPTPISIENLPPRSRPFVVENLPELLPPNSGPRSAPRQSVGYVTEDVGGSLGGPVADDFVAPRR